MDLVLGTLGGDSLVGGWVASSDYVGVRLTTWSQQPSGDFAQVGVHTAGFSSYVATLDLDADGVVDLVGGAEDRVWVHWGAVETSTVSACE